MEKTIKKGNPRKKSKQQSNAEYRNRWGKFAVHASRDSDIYKRWLKRVKDKYKQCMICNSIDDLQAHHVLPYSINKLQRYTLSNGRLLCKSCHDTYHKEYPIEQCNLNTFNQFVKKYQTNE